MNQRELEKTIEEMKIKAQELIMSAYLEYLGKRASRAEDLGMTNNGETEGNIITA